ncbi:MAG: hypothetical protein FGM62_04850, partial [Methylobacterium sp.]|nr:hypothetical protein [Methylobacterium sp.]
MINRQFRNLVLVFLLGIWLALPTGARAALTDIANTPLSSPNTSVVRPNLMFVLDDSGSMNYEYTPDAVRTNQWCYDAGIEASNSTTNRNDQCAAGDVPDFSPDTNFQYYNPAITYKPAVCYNGVCTTYPNSNAFAARTDPFNVRNIDQLGTSRTTLNLTNAYPERVWCVNSGSVVTDTNQCKRNTAPAGSNAYLFPVLGFQTPKYRNSNPHYFRPIPTEYCETPALTSCIPASAPTIVGPINYIVPATLRWCQNAAQTDLLVPQTNCQARYDDNRPVPRYLGTVVSSGSGGASARASFTVSTATAGLALNQLIVRDSAGNNPVNIINTLINATGNTVTTAQAICNAINVFVSSPDFRAGTGTSFNNCSTASAQVNVEAVTVGTLYNGYTINLGTAPGNKGETQAT